MKTVANETWTALEPDTLLDAATCLTPNTSVLRSPPVYLRADRPRRVCGLWWSHHSTARSLECGACNSPVPTNIHAHGDIGTMDLHGIHHQSNDEHAGSVHTGVEESMHRDAMQPASVAGFIAVGIVQHEAWPCNPIGG